MTQHQFEITALPENLCKIRGSIEPIVQKLGFDEDQIYHILLAVDEACSNVIRHAYASGKDEKNKIELSLDDSENKLKIKIRDYGIKCDPSNICGRDLNEVKPGGLGVHLIHGCMDQVYFNCDVEEGNELILIKNFNSKRR